MFPAFLLGLLLSLYASAVWAFLRYSAMAIALFLAGTLLWVVLGGLEGIVYLLTMLAYAGLGLAVVAAGVFLIGTAQQKKEAEHAQAAARAERDERIAVAKVTDALVRADAGEPTEVDAALLAGCDDQTLARGQGEIARRERAEIQRIRSAENDRRRDQARARRKELFDQILADAGRVTGDLPRLAGRHPDQAVVARALAAGAAEKLAERYYSYDPTGIRLLAIALAEEISSADSAHVADRPGPEEMLRRAERRAESDHSADQRALALKITPKQAGDLLVYQLLTIEIETSR